MSSRRLSTCSKLDLLEALVHVGLHELEALVDLLEALAHQLALVLELLFDAHHALAQLDLVDHGRFAQRLLGQPLTEVRLDEFDVFLCECHGDRSLTRGLLGVGNSRSVRLIVNQPAVGFKNRLCEIGRVRSGSALALFGLLRPLRQADRAGAPGAGVKLDGVLLAR